MVPHRKPPLAVEPVQEFTKNWDHEAQQGKKNHPYRKPEKPYPERKIHFEGVRGQNESQGFLSEKPQ